MIRFSIFLWFVLTSPISFTQVLPDGVLLKQGKEFTTLGKRKIKKLVTKPNGELVAYTRKENSFEFLLFDKTLNLIKSYKEVLKSGSKKLQFVRLVKTKAGIFVFSSYEDNFLNRKVLYYQHLNSENLTLSMAKILHSKAYNSKGGNINFHIEVSSNLDYLMVDVTSGVSSNRDDYGMETFDIVVFDNDFNKVWREDDIILLEDDERMFRSNRIITDDGKVIMKSFSIVGDINELDLSDDLYSIFKYHVVVVSKGKEYVMYELKSESGYFSDVNYKVAKNGNLNVIAVSYDKKEDASTWYFSVLDLDSGVFVLENKSDFEDTQGIVFNIDDLEDEVMQLIQSSPYMTANSHINSNFLLGDFFIDEKGTTVTFQSSVTSNNSYPKSKVLVGVGAARFNEKGKLQWQKGLQKIQYALNLETDYLASGVLNANGEVSFVFNFKPIEQTHGNLISHAWNAKGKTDLYLATIDTYGDMNVNVLLQGAKSPFWMPAYEFSSDKNEIIFVGYSGKKSKLAKLSINKL